MMMKITYIHKRLVKWFKDSSSSVRHLCHHVDIVITSTWAMDHDPMLSKPDQAVCLWKEFHSGQALAELSLNALWWCIIAATPVALPSASLWGRSFGRWTSAFTDSVVSYTPVLVLLGFCSYCNESRSNISLLQEVVFFLPTMQHLWSSQFSLESDVWVNQ